MIANQRLLTAAFFTAPFLGLASTAAAQTPLSGDVFDGQGGPLLAGTVYLATADLTVPAGQLLTVEPGAIVKFANGTSCEVLGDLIAAGGTGTTAFTSVLDDSIGGDTGADGPTSGVPGAWGGLRALPGSNIVVEGALLSFGGGLAPVVSGEGGAIELRDNTLSFNSGAGLDGLGLDAPLTVEGCAFENNTGWAVFNVRIEQLSGFSNNTAADNGIADAVQVAFGDIERDVAITADNLVGGVLVTRSSLNLNAGVTVELGPGVIVKTPAFAVGNWEIDGTLNIAGTAADPVIFTSTADDTVGGDTPKDGLTLGAPGQWGGLRARTGGALIAQHLEVRHGGVFGLRAVLAEGGSLTLAHSRMFANEGPGVDINSQTTAVSIIDCDIDENTGVAIDNAPISILVGLDGNRASGNLQGDAVRGSLQPVAGDEEILARNLLNETLRIPGGADLLVLGGATLTLQKGVILKWESPGALEVLGTLNALGTGARPVVLTSLEDDEFGADAAGDGPTIGTPGQIGGLRMRVESTGTLEHLRVRFAGAVDAAALLIESPATTLRSVRADRSAFSGIRLFELNDPAFNLIADNNAEQGILLEGGEADVVHATSANNGLDGIGRDLSYTGVVRNSIAWNNGTDLVGFASTADITDSLASNIPAGANNQTADPLFVDAAGGDLSLDPLSPAIDAGDPAMGVLVASDHL